MALNQFHELSGFVATGTSTGEIWLENAISNFAECILAFPVLFGCEERSFMGQIEIGRCMRGCFIITFPGFFRADG